MENHLILSLRNALAFSILFSAIALAPSPFMRLQRVCVRTGLKILACRKAMKHTLRKKSPTFWEIDMTEYNALKK